jgi:hypothetical protein
MSKLTANRSMQFRNTFHIKMIFALSIGVVASLPSARRDHVSAREPTPSEAALAWKVLRDALANESGFLKVHAAEYLLALGARDEVAKAFQEEFRLHPNEPKYRIGIWRVLAQTTDDVRKKNEYVDRIRQAFLDVNGPDRIHAIESLAKLKVNASSLSERELDSLSESVAPQVIVYRRWFLANSGEISSLRDVVLLAQDSNPQTRYSAATALRHLSKGWTRKDLNRLVELASREPVADVAMNLWCATVAASQNMQERQQFKQQLLSKHSQTAVNERSVKLQRDLAAALAIVGDYSDLPVLTSLAKDSQPEARISGAYAILCILHREQPPTSRNSHQ